MSTRVSVPSARQLGRFRVHARFFEGIRPGEGVNVFHDMIVLDIRHHMDTGEIEYFGLHPSFRVVPFGERVPEYAAEFGPDSAVPQWRERSAHGADFAIPDTVSA